MVCNPASQVRVAEPIDPAMDQTEPEQHPVDHAEGGVEHPFPGECRQHGGNDEGQQDECPCDGFAFEMVV
jgi:hypothetical protein